MSDVYEFEPGASPPLLFELVDDEDANLDPSTATLELGVVLPDRSVVYLPGVWDVEQTAFRVDIDPLAEDLTSLRCFKAYVYIDFGNGIDNHGELTLKPMEGARWQRST